MGFNARWGVLGAADVGANHQRDRIWIVGNQVAYASHIRCKRGGESWPSQRWEHKQLERLLEQVAQTGIPAGKHNRIHDGVAARVDRLKAIGNGQVPLCAATAWQLLSK
jgi:DNA (cytosine-5)-methyltransferase 1